MQTVIGEGRRIEGPTVSPKVAQPALAPHADASFFADRLPTRTYLSSTFFSAGSH